MKNKTLLRIFAISFSLVLLASCFFIAPSADIDTSLPLYQVTIKNTNSVDAGYLSDFNTSKTQIVYGNSIGVNAIVRPMTVVPVYPNGVYDPVFYTNVYPNVDAGDQTISSFGRDTKQFFVENNALYLSLTANGLPVSFVTRANTENILESYFYYNGQTVSRTGTSNMANRFKNYIPHMNKSLVGYVTYFMHKIDSEKVSYIFANKDVIGTAPHIWIYNSDGSSQGGHRLVDLLDDNGYFYLEEGKSYFLGYTDYNPDDLSWIDDIQLMAGLSHYWNYQLYEVLPNTFNFVIRQQDTIQGNLTRLFKLAENGAVSISSPLADDAWQDGYDLGENNGYSTGYGVGYESGYGVGYSEGQNYGYGKGYESGYGVGHQEGLDLGVEAGLEAGYKEGYAEAKALYDGSLAWMNMKNLIFAIFDAPFYVISYSLDFDLFGINIAGTLIALISTALIVWILKIIIVKLF